MKRLVLLVCLLACALPAGAQETRRETAGAEEFSFYGLRFGMSPEEVLKAYPQLTADHEAVNPGHGMLYLAVKFDFRRRLSEIRVSYERPEDALRLEGLQRALRERFVQPVSARWRDVAVTFDEYSNRAATTMVFSAINLREDAILHYKGEYLRQME